MTRDLTEDYLKSETGSVFEKEGFWMPWYLKVLQNHNYCIEWRQEILTRIILTVTIQTGFTQTMDSKCTFGAISSGQI